MAWPPGILPVNRTDSTPQQTTHAADHNAVNGAVNDTVTQLKTVSAALVRTGTDGQSTGTSIPAGTLGDLRFDNMTDPTYGGLPNITIPAAAGGIWSISLTVNGPTMPAGAFADCRINIFGRALASFIPSGKSSATVSFTLPVAGGTVFKCDVYNASAGSAFFAAYIAMFKVAG